MLQSPLVRASFLLGAFAAGVAGACSTTPTFVADKPACSLAGDCPGQDNECSHRTCETGTCGVAFEPKGFVVVAQSSGDCQTATCDGMGAVAATSDDTDLPNDGNTCTSDVCMAGVATNPPRPSGTPCGASPSLTCDGSGSCTGCTKGSDCGTDNGCISYGCSNSKCTITYVPADTATTTGQAAGDCHELVCNGKGGVKSIVDDTDAPDDGNECTSDVCMNGAPSHANEPAGTVCAMTHECDGKGTCDGCSVDTDCGTSGPCATFQCMANSCVNTFVPDGMGAPPGDQPGDCKKPVCDGKGGTRIANDDSDVPMNMNPCVDKTCSGGVPMTKFEPVTTACGNLHCDGAGNCTGCMSIGDCPMPTACTAYLCQQGNCNPTYVAFGQGNPGPDAPGNCQKNACDGMGGTTQVADDTDTPADDGSQCTSETCTAGVPHHPAKSQGTACNQSGGHYCDGGGSCVECLLANQCSGGGACSQAVCSNGSCNVNNTPQGTVSPQQTAGNCHQEICDGSGNTVPGPVDDMDVPNDNNVCTKDVCTNGIPSNPAKAIPSDGNQCTLDTCDPVMGFSYPPAPQGTLCYCLGTCDGMGGCDPNCDPNCEDCIGKICKVVNPQLCVVAPPPAE